MSKAQMSSEEWHEAVRRGLVELDCCRRLRHHQPVRVPDHQNHLGHPRHHHGRRRAEEEAGEEEGSSGSIMRLSRAGGDINTRRAM